ncbi:hypothetical protein [Streptomyces daghestanicus]|uniref:Integral membrane protein n=1 Tax=Streptomyces daghestanicus TaxID=66885 RepID=A0ABQ3Q8P3_9ACTN|nr:hypothetical protein [Streptomyces daghestanicus]GGU46838.1 hypothetical protein GCM10010259_42260 [Streptomyces daghestanicus]GHI33659.1 hypothetical protein Sdagh_53890 [Streptomyces daghestanicus]
MTDAGWDDCTEYHEAVRRAERVTRFGRAAITGTVGALGCALLALLAVAVPCAVAFIWVVTALNR